MTIEQILDTIAPQFSSSANKNDHITLARQRTSSSCFGDKYNYAVALRAAHTLTLANLSSSTGGGAGQISSIREMDRSITFYKTGSNNSSSQGLLATSYGVELQDMINNNILGYGVTASLFKFCDN